MSAVLTVSRFRYHNWHRYLWPHGLQRLFRDLLLQPNESILSLLLRPRLYALSLYHQPSQMEADTSHVGNRLCRLRRQLLLC